jgi:SAM-dependent methyltransferase
MNSGVDRAERVVARVRDAYEGMASEWLRWSEASPYNEHYERPALRSLIPDVSGLRVLDAGCAAGSHAVWLADHGATVTAIDISPGMVEIAGERLRSRGEAHVADLSQPLSIVGDETLDIVVASLCLDYVEDWSRPIAEFRRALCPGGLFVFSVEHPLTTWLLRGGESYFRVELQEMEFPRFPGRPVIPTYRRPLSAMIEPLASAGFLVDRLVEPLPSEEFARVYPEEFAELSQHPAFLLIRAVRP